MYLAFTIQSKKLVEILGNYERYADMLDGDIFNAELEEGRYWVPKKLDQVVDTLLEVFDEEYWFFGDDEAHEAYVQIRNHNREILESIEFVSWLWMEDMNEETSFDYYVDDEENITVEEYYSPEDEEDADDA